MRTLAIFLLFAATQAWGQSTEERDASEAENRAVAYIVDCMVSGLPEDWRRATMEVNLEKPFDDTGSVRYVFSRDDSVAPAESFQPCDLKKPARTVIDLRDTLPAARRGWIGVQVTVLRDGRFGIRYGFPKP
jgi:hypothetical protein